MKWHEFPPNSEIKHYDYISFKAIDTFNVIHMTGLIWCDWEGDTDDMRCMMNAVCIVWDIWYLHDKGINNMITMIRITDK